MPPMPQEMPQAPSLILSTAARADMNLAGSRSRGRYAVSRRSQVNRHRSTCKSSRVLSNAFKWALPGPKA